MEYEKCLVQVYEILNHLDEEEIIKIPESVIKNIEERKDKNYKWIYDETKDLIEQDLDRRTVAILSYINMEYLLNEEEKEALKELHEANEAKLFPKIGTVNFSKPVIYETTEENSNRASLVETKEQKWHQKVWNLFMHLVRNKNRKEKI